ncbi:MAG: class I SAM-dependent methyltransferase [Alphaproteobacteria bacterium]|nr:MAG: class I SAM-dependent methyltransferase [Alphaproteobacteria bacterium]
MLINAMHQADSFLSGEADQWFARNREALATRRPENDPIMAAIGRLGITPRRAVELGAANGYRLNWLHEQYGTDGVGIEPSAAAVADGRTRFAHLKLEQGLAHDIARLDGPFDLVIFGFCLYLVDRDGLFGLAAAVDQALASGGHLAIYDFQPPMPLRNAYAYKAGLFSFKLDYGAMFAWNPAYIPIYRHITDHDGRPFSGHPNEAVGVTVLKKVPGRYAYARGDAFSA